MIHIIFFVIFCKFSFTQCYEYQINKIIPSYVNKSFQGLSEDVFPRDISIEISLSRVAGTLLYSIDSRNNQLIVSLTDSNVPTLAIEVNNANLIISIPKLCGCQWCKFERLRLRVEMRDKFSIRCNNGEIHSLEYNKDRRINKDYPTPSFAKSDKLDALLWLVNTPQIGGIYPNGDQLRGCIHGVWYNDVEVEMETHGVTDKCSITCTKDVCNSGTCLETHNDHPVCNCTSSFRNGQYCNDTMENRNINISASFVFNAFKLSFNSTADDIMELSSRSTSLKVFVEAGKLIFRISCRNGISVTTDVIVSPQYRMKAYNILVIEFYKNVLYIKFRSNASPWTHGRIDYSGDLSGNVFNNLVLRGGTGVIDMVYKNNLDESVWIGLPYHKGSALQMIEKYRGGDSMDAIIRTSDNSTTIPSDFTYTELVALYRNIDRKVTLVSVVGGVTLVMVLVMLIMLTLANVVHIKIRTWKFSRSHISEPLYKEQSEPEKV